MGRTPPKPIQAHVVLRGPKGQLSTAALNLDNIDDFLSSPETRERVSRFLDDHGLQVVSSGAFSLAVQGTPETFEKVFGGQLRFDQNRWVWASPPTIPKPLRGDIDAITFPQPTRSLARP
jgi:hypothetical protein